MLTQKVRENATIDWTIKESVKAKLKVVVKRVLKQYGYPPDMQKLAAETVLKQAELMAEELVSRLVYPICIPQNQKPLNHNKLRGFLSTRGGNRTRTVLLPLDFESSASTNSATRAKTVSKTNDFNRIIKILNVFVFPSHSYSPFLISAIFCLASHCQYRHCCIS